MTDSRSIAVLHPHFIGMAHSFGILDLGAAALKDARPPELTEFACAGRAQHEAPAEGAGQEFGDAVAKVGCRIPAGPRRCLGFPGLPVPLVLRNGLRQASGECPLGREPDASECHRW